MGDEPIKAQKLEAPLAGTSAPRDREPHPADVEKVEKWQEERIERILRGEYEAQVLRLGELVNSNRQTPLHVTAVRVEGAKSTRSSFLDWLIKPHLTAIAGREDAPTTVEDVLRATKNINNSLLRTDVFAAVEARIESSRDILSREGDVELVFKTRQKGHYYLKTATEIGDQDGSVSVQARFRNTFGGAETLEASFSSGIKTRMAGHLSLTGPLTPSLRTNWELSAFGVERDCTHFASCFEDSRGIRAAIRSTTPATVHEVAYEAVVRHVRGLLPSASIGIREEAGLSTKSALSHSWTLDTRDDRAVASRGIYLRTLQELAGLGGDAHFYKTQFNFHISRVVTKHSTLSLAGKSGLLYALTSPPAAFSDRFQLGGPFDVRLFRQNGLGPRDGADSLGGNLCWAVGLSLISDLPLRPRWPVKTHVFVNAGRLDVLDKSRSLADNITACVSKPSISAGIGLLYRLDPVRVELNFGVPLAASKSDGRRRGFQLGIGLDFL